MGGTSGTTQPTPTTPSTLDYGAIMNSAMQAQLKAYPQMANEQLQYNPYFSQQALGQVNNVAALLSGDPSQQYNLTPITETTGKGPNAVTKVVGMQQVPTGMTAGNTYTQRANDVINRTMTQGTGALIDSGNRINGLGDLSNLVAQQAQQRSLAGPTSIEQGLYDQTASDLALGSKLNPEEERAASQQANAAWSARGLGTGSSAAASDLLNRYQYGQARLQQRQQAASGANQLLQNNMNNRATIAGNLLGNTANIYGQAGGAYQNAAQLGYGGASALVNLDPMQRAMGIGVNLGTSINGQTGQMIGNTYNNALQTAGDVASFNSNMQSAMYNGYYNNQTALASSKNAANAQLMGAGIGASATIGAAAAVCWIARACFGTDSGRWMEFRSAMLRNAPDMFIRNYCRRGPRLADWISSHRWARIPVRFVLSSLQSAWS